MVYDNEGVKRGAYHSVTKELLSILDNVLSLVQRQLLQGGRAIDDATLQFVKVVLIHSSRHSLVINIASALEAKSANRTTLTLDLRISLQKTCACLVETVYKSSHGSGIVILDILVHRLK